MESLFRIEPLSKDHDRGSFSCGIEALDNYLKKQASQDIKRYLAKCFIAVDNTNGQIVVFYTLSAGSIPLESLPQNITKGIRYHDVPVTILGRFAVDETYQGQHIGGALLAYACEQALNSPLSSIGVIVDAKDQKSEAFYLHHDFEYVEIQNRRLILTFKKFLEKLN